MLQGSRHTLIYLAEPGSSLANLFSNSSLGKQLCFLFFFLSAGPRGTVSEGMVPVSSWLCGENGRYFLDKEWQFPELQRNRKGKEIKTHGEDLQGVLHVQPSEIIHAVMDSLRLPFVFRHTTHLESH